MKVVILSGSPKGSKSITWNGLQKILKSFPMIEWKEYAISQKINVLEKHGDEYNALLQDIKSCDGVLWIFPVYIYMVPSGVKRFVELINHQGDSKLFDGKYTAVYSTSIHFFDTIAHNYLHAVLDDWNAKFSGSMSAAMDDILKPSGKDLLKNFIQDFIDSIQEQRITQKVFPPLTAPSTFEYHATDAQSLVQLNGKNVLIIHDAEKGCNLDEMIKTLKSGITNAQITEVNIREMKLKGSCLGCCKCALDNQCVYGDKDDIRHLYLDLYPAADIIIFGGTIQDRFLSARWKMVIDRRFMRTHQPLLSDKQVIWLISGPLAEIENLRRFMEADTMLGGANLAGIVTDESEDQQTIEKMIYQTLQRTAHLCKTGLKLPMRFEAVAGKKIFRDEIWGNLRFAFQADHRYFESHDLYDFPQNNMKMRIRNFFMMGLTKIPSVRKKMRAQMTDLMLKPYLES